MTLTGLEYFTRYRMIDLHLLIYLSFAYSRDCDG